MAFESLVVTSREPYEDGKRWGARGAYEVIRGTATFALDPLADCNQRITDIQLAERGPDGLVRAESDFCVLRPANNGDANGGLFFSVANRGNVTLPFGRGPAPDLASLPAGTIPSSDCVLLYEGWTVAWCGWQFDLKRGPRQLGITVPQALQDGKPVEGNFRIELRATADSPSLRLLDGTAIMAGRTQPVYPPAGLDQPGATLTERPAPAAERMPVPRYQWQFAHEKDGQVEPDDAHIWMAGGFKAGYLYELVYKTGFCPVAGMGMAAVRDFVSALRHGNHAAELGTAAIDRTIGMGVSQTGRWLFQYLSDGLNVDEQGSTVFDGLFIHIAGGRSGEFNHRYAQPNEALASGFGDLCSKPWGPPEPGVLDRQRTLGGVPKIFWVNSAWEYWRGDASLTHTTPDGSNDVPNPPNVRSFLMAGVDHLGANTTMARALGIANEPTGVDPSPLVRALFTHLAEWVTNGTEPPASRIPSIKDGTAVSRESILDRAERFPNANLPSKEALPRVREVFLGPDVDRGIGSWPAEYGDTKATLVSAVDDDGNEVAGVRLPEQQVPIATLAGWNTPRAYTDLRPLSAMPGSQFAFARTAAERQATGDPRPSIEERYRDRDHYRELVADAADALVEDGFVLAIDRDFAIEAAMQGWDAAMGE